MIAWEGYFSGLGEPFEKSSGCTVHPKYAGPPTRWSP